ncbi:MAG TPA: hypothetical protein VGM62_17790 [Chthoniobacterales bacterium]
MTSEETAILESLDQIVWSPAIQAILQPVVRRVSNQLAGRTEPVMAWEPISTAKFGSALPRMIQSAWVFILRAGVNTGAERHPNSHQRMMSFAGSGDMQTREKEEASWKSNILLSDRDLPLAQRWISIPQNVWHQPVVADNSDWVVVSFHTVPADELIEERPDPQHQAGTKQMRYLS